MAELDPPSGVVSKNSIPAPTVALERKFGPLLNKLEQRSKNKGEMEAKAPIAARDAESNVLLTDTYATNLRDNAKSAHEGVSAAGAGGGGAATTSLVASSTTGNALADRHVNEVDTLVETHYSALTEHVDIGNVQDLPISGIIGSCSSGSGGGVRNTHSQSNNEHSSASTENNAAVTKEHEEHVGVVQGANQRHNVVIAEHREKWDTVKQRLQKDSQESQAKSEHLDLQNFGSGQSDALIRSADAKSNYAQIKKIVESTQRDTSSDDDDDEFEDYTDADGNTQRRRKGRLAGFGGNVLSGFDAYSEDRFQEYQRLLNEATTTIEQLKSEHSSRIEEMTLYHELAIKAFEAKYHDEATALRNEVEACKHREAKVKEEALNEVETANRGLDDAMKKLEIAVISKHTSEIKLKTRVAELESDLESTESQLKIAFKENMEAQAMWDSEESRMRSDIEQLKSHNAKLEIDLEEERTKLKIAREEVDACIEGQKTLEKDVSESNLALEESKRSLVAVAEKAETLNKTRETFEKGVWAQFEDQVSRLQENTKTLVEEKHVAANKTRVLEEQLDKLQSSLKEVEVQRRQVKSIFAELQRSQKTATDLQVVVEEQHKRKMEFICQNVILRAKCLQIGKTTTFQNRIADLEEQNAWLTDKISAMNVRKIKVSPHASTDTSSPTMASPTIPVVNTTGTGGVSFAAPELTVTNADGSPANEGLTVLTSAGLKDPRKGTPLGGATRGSAFFSCSSSYRSVLSGDERLEALLSSSSRLEFSGMMMAQHERDVETQCDLEAISDLKLFKTPTINVDCGVQVSLGEEIVGGGLSPRLQRYVSSSPHRKMAISIDDRINKRYVELMQGEEMRVSRAERIKRGASQDSSDSTTATLEATHVVPRPASAASGSLVDRLLKKHGTGTQLPQQPPRPSSALSDASSVQSKSNVTAKKSGGGAKLGPRPQSASSTKNAKSLHRHVPEHPVPLDTQILGIQGSKGSLLSEAVVGTPFSEYYQTQHLLHLEDQRGLMQESIRQDILSKSGKVLDRSELGLQGEGSKGGGAGFGNATSPLGVGGLEPEEGTFIPMRKKNRPTSATPSGYNQYSQHFSPLSEEGAENSSPSPKSPGDGDPFVDYSVGGDPSLAMVNNTKVGHTAPSITTAQSHNLGSGGSITAANSVIWQPTSYTIGTTTFGATQRQGVQQHQQRPGSATSAGGTKNRKAATSTGRGSTFSQEATTRNDTPKSTAKTNNFEGFKPHVAPVAGSWRPRKRTAQ